MLETETSGTIPKFCHCFGNLGQRKRMKFDSSGSSLWLPVRVSFCLKVSPMHSVLVFGARPLKALDARSIRVIGTKVAPHSGRKHGNQSD